MTKSLPRADCEEMNDCAAAAQAQRHHHGQDPVEHPAARSVIAVNDTVPPTSFPSGGEVATACGKRPTP